MSITPHRVATSCDFGLFLLSRLLGRRCQLCLQPLAFSETAPVCSACAQMLAPRTGGFCPQCGDCYADETAPVYRCLTCRAVPPRWENLYFVGAYKGQLKELIHRHKFGCDLGVGSLISYLIEKMCEIRMPRIPDVVIPVPLHTRRLQERGFNQSVELSRVVARRLGCGMNSHVLRKCRETAPQSSLGRRARRSNLCGAFDSVLDLAGKRVLLVDDVMTTGATLTECASVCLNAGAHSVDVFVLARALRV